MTKSDTAVVQFTPVQSRAIDLLKILLAVLVVAAHCGFHTPINAADNTYLYHAIYSTIFLDVLKPTSAVFFFLSGYLYFRGGAGLTFSAHCHKWCSRIRTLLVPYIVWNTIALLLILVKVAGPWNHYFPQYDMTQWSIGDVLYGYIAFYKSMPYDFPLWFMRNLLIVVVFAPLIGLMISRLRLWSVPIALLVLQLFHTFCPLVASWWLPQSFFCFICGGVFVTCAGKFLSSRGVGVWILVYIMACVTFRYVPSKFIAYWSAYSLKVLVFALVMFKVAMAIARTKLDFHHRWVVYSFFVFLMHGLFVTLTHKVVCTLIPAANNMLCLVDFVLIFSVLLFVPLCTALILHRWCPRSLRFLTGGR